MTKRTLTIILCLCMLVSFLPTLTINAEAVSGDNVLSSAVKNEKLLVYSFTNTGWSNNKAYVYINWNLPVKEGRFGSFTAALHSDSDYEYKTGSLSDTYSVYSDAVEAEFAAVAEITKYLLGKDATLKTANNIPTAEKVGLTGNAATMYTNVRDDIISKVQNG